MGNENSRSCASISQGGPLPAPEASAAPIEASGAALGGDGQMPTRVVLESLNVSQGRRRLTPLKLSPDFSPDITQYRAAVPYDVDSVVLRPGDNLPAHLQVTVMTLGRGSGVEVVDEWVEEERPAPPLSEEEKQRRAQENAAREAARKRREAARARGDDENDDYEDEQEEDEEQEEEEVVAEEEEEERAGGAAAGAPPVEDEEPEAPAPPVLLDPNEVNPNEIKWKEPTKAPNHGGFLAGDFEVTPGNPDAEGDESERKGPRRGGKGRGRKGKGGKGKGSAPEDDPFAPLPEPPTTIKVRVRVIRINFLKVGENPLAIRVTSSLLPEPRVYVLRVNRAQWTRDGWQPGNKRDKFNWYLRGAQDGLAEAQYHLSTMYAGDDVSVVEWDEFDVHSGEQARERREKAREAMEEKRLADDAQGDGAAGGGAAGGAAGGKLRASSSAEDFDAMGVHWADDWLESNVHNEAVQREMDEKKRAEFTKHARINHFKWLHAAANQGYAEACYRLANLYYSGGVPPEILAEEEEAEKMQLKRIEAAEASLEDGGLKRRQEREALKAKYADADFSKKQAAKWFEACANLGDVRAAFQLAQMYVDGVGVPMDFRAALFWFVERARVPEAIARQSIRKKFTALKPKYRRLFSFHDVDNDGRLDFKEFQNFYRDMWMATGQTQKQATQRALGTYGGKQRVEVLFNAYDVDRDHKITFEEIWSHPHTHTSLIPKKEEQLVKAEAFFRRWLLKMGQLERSESHRFTLLDDADGAEHHQSPLQQGQQGPAPQRQLSMQAHAHAHGAQHPAAAAQSSLAGARRASEDEAWDD